MTLTIELTPDIENSLQEEAGRRGMNPMECARKLIEEALPQNSQSQKVVGNGSLIVTPTHIGIPETEVTDSLARLRPRYKRMLDNLAK